MKEKIGIYQIKCLVNGKVYIGQTKNFASRFSRHKCDLKHNRHQSYYLQEDFTKYGQSNFSFDVLLALSEEDFSQEKLDKLEKDYIALTKSDNRDFGYNIEKGGLAQKIIAEETREKISIAQTGKRYGKRSEETRELMRKNHAHYWKGKKMSEEARLNMSKVRKGKPSHLKGKKLSKERVDKLIENSTGRVWVYNNSTERFVTQEEADSLLRQGYKQGRKPINGKHYYEYDGKMLTVAEIARIKGISSFTIYQRIRKGMTVKDAVETPIK